MPHGAFKGMIVDKRHSKLLGAVGETVTSKLLNKTTPTPIGFIGSRGNPYAAHSRHTGGRGGVTQGVD